MAPNLAQMVKNLSAMQETQVQSLGWEDPLERGMATHSSILPWRIPWTEEPVGYCPWVHKESEVTELLTLLSGLNNRNLLSHSSGGKKSETFKGTRVGSVLDLSLTSGVCVNSPVVSDCLQPHGL